MVKIVNFCLKCSIVLNLISCSPVSSIVSVAANAGISSKGFSASVDDTIIKAKIIKKISSLDISNFLDITVSVSMGEVLLTGYVDNQTNRLRVVESVWKVNDIKKVYNEIIVSPNVSIMDKTEDAIFESRIMTRLLFKSGINSNNYSIDVVDGTVFAIGLAEDLDEKTKFEQYLAEMNDIPKLVTIIKLINMEDQNY
ncbi:MAG: BON domain-containing protein [Alphaproteobacteria bacterium]